MPRSRWFDLATAADGPPSLVLPRVVAGAIFVSEGLQKFLFPGELGAGRFVKIGIPWPEVMGPFVGGLELVAGALLVAGLFTRAVGVPLLVTMTVAIVSTKIIPLPEVGFWKTAHGARTDLLMLATLGLLLRLGGGPRSVDGWLAARRRAS
jgi:uncharacterized membrane protein YphA (DoxX/SURF4 family)